MCLFEEKDLPTRSASMLVMTLNMPTGISACNTHIYIYQYSIYIYNIHMRYIIICVYICNVRGESLADQNRHKHTHTQNTHSHTCFLATSSERQRRERSQLRRLHYNRTPCGERSCRFSGDHGRWEVPWGDRCYDTHGCIRDML